MARGKNEVAVGSVIEEWEMREAERKGWRVKPDLMKRE